MSSILEEARRTARAILREIDWPEHPALLVSAGSIWVYDPITSDSHWKLYRSYFAIDYEFAWMLKPDRAEVLRQHAESLVQVFPTTLNQMERLGCTQARPILHERITTPVQATNWALSIWNSCTPVPFDEPVAGEHPWGVLAHRLESKGFIALHSDVEGYVAVLPASGHRTQIWWASDGSTYAPRVGEYLGARHPVSLAAYARRKG